MPEGSRIKPAPHPRTMGWVGASSLAMGGSNQSLFLLAALLTGQGSIRGQGTAAVPLLFVGLVLGWMALPGWTELVLMWPNRVGGIAATCGEAFRPYAPVLGNLVGTAYWWGWVPTCGLTALLSASALHQWFLPTASVPLLASGLVLVFTAVNLFGVRWASRVAIPIATASALLAFLSCIIPVASGTVDWHRAASFSLDTPFTGRFGKITSAMAGLYLVGFAAPAFEAAACHVGEMRDPAKNVPRAMFASATMATVYFLFAPVIWLGTIGEKGLSGDLAVTLGPTFAPLAGASAKSFAIWFMTFNMFHGTLAPLTGVARTLSQLSEDGLLPEVFARRNRWDCPWVAIVITAAFAIGFLLVGDPVWLVAAANFTYLIGISLPSVAVWLLRKDQPDHPRPYRAPRGTIALGLVAAAVWGTTTVLGFQQFGLPTVLLGLVLAYSGAALYAVRRFRDRRKAKVKGNQRSLHLKLTGAMLLVLALDGAGYLMAVSSVDTRHSALVAALEDIFVAVAMLTITVGLVLPGMIAHSAVEVSNAANRLATGTLADFSRAMGALASGDLDGAHARVDLLPILVHSRDEVGDMAASFNHLQEEVARAALGLDGAREGLRAARGELTEINASLERRVLDRTTELEALHRKLVDAARQAGMAEVAIGILHNVGNVLNSVNVSASIVEEKVRRSRVGQVGKVGIMLGERAALAATEDRDRQIPGYLVKLSSHLESERAEVLAELSSLGKNIEHIKQVVSSQTAYARGATMAEWIQPTEIFEDALRITATTFDGVAPERDYRGAEPALLDKHLVLQILVNLVSNATHALRERAPEEKRLCVRVGPHPSAPERLVWEVRDNGVGIAPEALTRIFAHGFTTRVGGQGVGLHSAAIAAKLMGGSLVAHSEGVGAGATFTLDLPLHAAEPAR